MIKRLVCSFTNKSMVVNKDKILNIWPYYITFLLQWKINWLIHLCFHQLLESKTNSGRCFSCIAVLVSGCCMHAGSLTDFNDGVYLYGS